MFELFVNTKKELQIAETPLFRAFKMVKNHYGGPEDFDIRTYKQLLSRMSLDKLKDFYKAIFKHS